jgi:hypothetical protein
MMQNVKLALTAHRMRLFIAGLCLSTIGTAAAVGKEAPPIEVMILGAYHMGNPGRDVNNAKVDSVLTAEKQKQLVEVTNRLAKFKPNKVAVEMTANRPDMTTTDFDKFTPDSLKSDANEINQIAYRLANQLGHKVVYAIDEQSETIHYFPYDKVEAFAKANHKEALLTAGRAWGTKITAEFETAQKPAACASC